MARHLGGVRRDPHAVQLRGAQELPARRRGRILNNLKWWVYDRIAWIYDRIAWIEDRAMYRRWFKKAVALIRELKTEYGPNGLPVIPGTCIRVDEWRRRGIKHRVCTITHYMGRSNLVGEKNTCVMICEKRRARVFYENMLLSDREYENAARYLEHLIREQLLWADEIMFNNWVSNSVCYERALGYRPYTVHEARAFVGTDVMWSGGTYGVHEITDNGCVVLDELGVSLEEAVLLLTTGDNNTPFGKKMF